MTPFGFFNRVSQAPTKPRPATAHLEYDVAELYEGVLSQGDAGASDAAPLDEKLRQAYFWIVNNAIISPHYDIEYNNGASSSHVVGDAKRSLHLPSGQSYSSYVLLPLLTFATRRKCLFVGGPGRGKTASAILMGVLAGYTPREVKRAMQHGHPQMTVADLLGNPLPADLVNAQNMADIRIAWRAWLGMRVKVIDEYNRIPTRTQSALLTVMGDNYAEVLNHIYECPEAAWYMTANDDRGGGTYEVIEALRDRIDVIVQALAFNARFLGELLARVEHNAKPEELVPPQIIFSEAECDHLILEIRGITISSEVRRRIEFFASQFELLETAGIQFEYLSKDTARLSEIDWAQFTSTNTGNDRLKDLGQQTRNGLSVRNLMTLLIYSKAMAYFRGGQEVDLEDVRQVLPFVLNDKLRPDHDAPFFNQPQNLGFKSDRLSWLRYLFDNACQEYDRLNLDRDDDVGELLTQLSSGLDGVSEREVRSRLVRIERLVQDRTKGRKLHGHLYDDLLALKYLHQRYTNYSIWLQQR